MHFDPSYFKEEERDGFVIKPMIKRAWAAQLEVLAVIDDICKRHNIMYYAEYGTLLGAVRHGGFIPWDDDMDIGMLRKDFERFQQIINQELPKGFEFLSIQNGNHDEFIARIVNSTFISTDPEFLKKFHGCPYVVGIDIFISDNIPLDKGEERVQLELIAATNTLAHKWHDDDMSEEEKLELLQEIQTLCNVTFSPDSPIDLQLFQLSDRLCAMYWDIEAKEVTFMSKLAIKPHYRLQRSWYDAVVEVPFDVTTIPIPIGYHHILPFRCGKNYMTPRFYHCHNYPFFKEQQEALFDYYNERNWIIPDEFKE